MKTTLGELIALQRGYDLTESQRRPGPIPVVGSAGIHGYHDEAKAPGPGVTLGRSGASFGKVTFVPVAFWPHNTTIFVTDFKGNYPAFIRYLLESLDFSSLNSGSAQQSLSRNSVYPVQVLKFDLPIQKRIAGILSAYDDLIENCQRRINILESMARALYREWFVHFRFPGYEGHRRVASPLGEIPEGWRCVTMSEVGELTVGGDWGKDEPEGDDWVQVGCLRGVDLHALAKSGASDVPVRWIKSNSLQKRRVGLQDVLVEGSGECGRSMAGSQYLETLVGLPIIYSNFCKRVRMRDPEVARFAEHMLNEMVASGEMVQFRTGTTIPNLNMTALFESHRFILPPARVLNQFVDLLRSSDAFKLLGRMQNLRRTRDLLLPRLLSGQIPAESLAT